MIKKKKQENKKVNSKNKFQFIALKARELGKKEVNGKNIIIMTNHKNPIVF